MRLADFDLNLLVALDALLAERNISRAASRVGVSQSAMSKALQRARTTFDDPLLIRLGREFSLTPFGLELASSIHDALFQLQKTIDRRPVFTPASDTRLFRIACSDATELLLLKPLLQRIADQAPGIRIAAQTLTGSLTGQIVERGDVDLALSSLRYYQGELGHEVLYTDRRVCAVWSLLADVRESLSWDQLLCMPHAGYNWPEHDPHRDIEQNEVPDHDVVERILVRFSDGNHLTRLLLLPGTDLVMFTYERVALHVSRIADIRIVLPPFVPLEIPFGMLWHPRNTDDPAHRWLRQQLAEIANAIPATHEDLETAADTS